MKKKSCNEGDSYSYKWYFELRTSMKESIKFFLLFELFYPIGQLKTFGFYPYLMKKMMVSFLIDFLRMIMI